MKGEGCRDIPTPFFLVTSNRHWRLNMQEKNDEVAMVPVVVYESMVERSRRIIRTIVIGWCVSMIALAAACTIVWM